jgi:hypothetical protein
MLIPNLLLLLATGTLTFVMDARMHAEMEAEKQAELQALKEATKAMKQAPKKSFHSGVRDLRKEKAKDEHTHELAWI